MMAHDGIYSPDPSIELKALLAKRSALANPSNFGEKFERLMHALASSDAKFFDAGKMRDIETGSNFHGLDELILSIAESPHFHEFDLKFLALLDGAEIMQHPDPKAFKFALYGAMLTQDIDMMRRESMATTLVSLGISENEIAAFHENRKASRNLPLGALDYETYAEFSELVREALGEIEFKKSMDDGVIRQLITPIVEDVSSSQTDNEFFGKIALFGGAVEKKKMSGGFKVKVNFCEMVSNRSALMNPGRISDIAKYLSLHSDDSDLSVPQKVALRRNINFLNVGDDDRVALTSVAIKLLRLESSGDQDETISDTIKPFVSHLSSIGDAERFEKNINAFSYLLKNSGFKNNFLIKSELCEQLGIDGDIDKKRIAKVIEVLTQQSRRTSSVGPG